MNKKIFDLDEFKKMDARGDDTSGIHIIQSKETNPLPDGQITTISEWLARLHFPESSHTEAEWKSIGRFLSEIESKKSFALRDPKTGTFYLGNAGPVMREISEKKGLTVVLIEGENPMNSFYAEIDGQSYDYSAACIMDILDYVPLCFLKAIGIETFYPLRFSFSKDSLYEDLPVICFANHLPCKDTSYGQ